MSDREWEREGEEIVTPYSHFPSLVITRGTDNTWASDRRQETGVLGVTWGVFLPVWCVCVCLFREGVYMVYIYLFIYLQLCLSLFVCVFLDFSVSVCLLCLFISPLCLSVCLPVRSFTHHPVFLVH